MPTYTAPLDDMMFLFENLRNNKNYNELDKYKEVTPDLVKDILQEAAKINQNLILPLAKAGDENPAVLENGVVRTPPGYKEAYKKFIEDGLVDIVCRIHCNMTTYVGIERYNEFQFFANRKSEKKEKGNERDN